MTKRGLLALLPLALIFVGAGSASAASGGTAQPHVVGGFPVSIDDFEWQAAVVFRDGNPNAFFRQFCGGSLVTSRIVLTAAHCIEDTDPDCTSLPDCTTNDDPGDDMTEKIDPDDVDVILGRTTLSSSAGVEHNVVDVAYQGDQLGELPAYNPSTLQNDVGYLVLDPATPTTETQIKLAAAAETALWTPGVFVDLTGWGKTSQSGQGSDTLRAGSAPMVSDSSCTASYGSEFDPASMVCAGYQTGGVDTCQGDSGGPLESPLLGGGYRLVGITSWGIGCALPNFPGVYTRVAETALRAAIVTKVMALENAQTPPISPNEDIVGDGLGQPRGGGPTFPPPTPVTSSPPVTLPAPTASAQDPFAKCRKIRSKKKRKKCNKNVRRSLSL